MAASARRITPWVTVATLLLLALGAGLGSAMTAPARTSATAPTTTTTTAPETSCPAPAGSPSITLSDMTPIPAITVSVNSTLVALVPPWPDESATDVHVVNPSVLSQTCTVLLPNGGRRTALYALAAGQTLITATVTPPTDTMMPAWEAMVTVTGTNPPPPAGAISTAIDLPSTTLVAGAMVAGALVVTNHTDHTINLTQGCQPQWAVGLQSPTIPFNPIFPALCDIGPLLVQPGTNRLPFMLSVRYRSCAPDTSSSCGGSPPPLPPGAYEAVLVSTSSVLSAPPLDVEVVAASGSG